MTSAYFEQEKSCPVCEEKFKTTRVRSSACVVVKRDTDFCVFYRDINPMHYSIHVCPHCHYAALDKNFSEPISTAEKLRLQKGLKLLKSDEPDLGKERDAQLALRANELAIQSAQIKHAGPGMIGSLFLRAAWFARELKNTELEVKYIEQARILYQESFEKERIREGKMTEARMMYIIGELNRRAGQYQEAVQWFSRVVTNRDVKKEPEIERLARDQWDLAKEQYKNPPKAETTKETATENVHADIKKERTKSKACITIYDDQLSWLKEIANKYNEQTKGLLPEEGIVRAMLDAIKESDLDLNSVASEKALKEQIKSLFKKTNTGA